MIRQLQLNQWTLRAIPSPQTPVQLTTPIEVMVPFSAPTEMMKAGKWINPLDDESSEKERLLEGVEWIAETTLPTFNNATRCYLSFLGLDTLCEIRINNQKIAETANQFRQWQFELSPQECSGQKIEIIFHCARQESQKKAQEWNIPMDWNGFSYTGNYVYPMIRKSAYAGGWDWLKTIPLSTGIWQPVYLNFWTNENFDNFQSLTVIDQDSSFLPGFTKIIRVEYQIQLKEDFSEAEIIPVLTLESDRQSTLLAELCVDGLELLPASLLRIPQGQSTHFLRSVKIIHPLLWWPHGLGQPHLYKMSLKIKVDDLHWIENQKKIGIRKIQLSHDEDGKGFRFIINDQPIFARGANWIPPIADSASPSDEKIYSLLRLAVDANFNLIRVWGGGYYESDFFYQTCDELGLMVWQDFLFACNLYPENPAFIDNLQHELQDQLTRLVGHPSLVLLCGNNECHCCYYEWMNKQLPDEFNGNLIYHKILPEAVHSWAPNIPYWPGSPWSQNLFRNPNSDQEGDRHAWNLVFGSNEDRQNYRCLVQEQGRFISEFGLVAMPNYYAFIDSLSTPEKIQNRLQKRANFAIGTQRLKEYIQQIFNLADEHDIKTFTILSQWAQAWIFRDAITQWRCRSNCGGFLIWHYADCWVAPSWGIIDGQGNPRISYWVTKSLCEPIFIAIPSIQPQQKQINIIISNDLSSPSENFHVIVEKYEKGQLSEKTEPYAIAMRSAGTRSVLEINLQTPITHATCIHAQLLNNKKLVSEATALPSPPKYLTWPESGKILLLHFSSVKNSTTEFSFDLLSHSVILGVVLNIDSIDPEAHFSNQAFDLFPGQQKQIHLKLSQSFDKIPLARLKTLIKVVSLSMLCGGNSVKIGYALPPQ